MAQTFEATVNAAITRAANEITAAVRADIAARIREVLGGTTTSPAATPKPKAVRVTRRRRRGSASNGALIDKVVAYIKANPGKRTEEISKGIGTDAKPALAKLRADKRVKTKGEKRATTYALA